MIKKVDVQIKGLAPYFFSKPTEDKTPKTDAQRIQVAKNRVYCNGNLYIPSRQIKGCMLNAIYTTKMKIERSSKRAKDLAASLVFVKPDEIYFSPKMKMKDVDLVWMWTHLDNDKIRNLPFACIPTNEWSLAFTIKYHEMLEADFLKEALDTGGLICGIGGKRLFRGNGKFEVTKWSV